jgi:hypothetical protein
MMTSLARAPEALPLVGIWTADDGYQILELLLRSDGRYQLETKSTDPIGGYTFTERGRYAINGQMLDLAPYDFNGEPQPKRYEFQVADNSLTLTAPELGLTQVYQFQPGSKAAVLERENLDPGLIGAWGRSIVFWGTEEYTFRPGGYYIRKSTPESSDLPPEFVRGRYIHEGARLVIHPYNGIEALYEIDFFGNTLTLIKKAEFYGESAAYEEVPGSQAEVSAKASDAEAFLGREHWQVGVWQIRDIAQTVELTIRPDGHYMARESTSDLLRGTVRGRYTLEPGRIRLMPFIGQDVYAHSNGEFGKVERTRVLDYYDGELQFIDPDAISHWVTLARKVPGSDAIVMDKTRQAQEERARDGWYVGIWEVNDPVGWMEFTYRPYNRYIVKSGTDRVPNQVERGRYRVGGDKVTLAPYSGLGSGFGQPRGFELDLYDGDLFLIGDSHRMVVSRKVAGSAAVVIEKTRDPEAMKGERGSILGLWTANLPGQSTELVFRPDGEFRSNGCMNDTISRDYGLYTVDMTTRTLVSDSRFVDVQTHGLDFYGNTMTIYGGLGPPRTYAVNPGVVDAAIAASLAADAQEEAVDAQWLARVPVGPRDPGAIQRPAGDIPADPNPGQIFDAPTVLTNFQLYRWLIPGFVYFYDMGTIRSVPVVHTREWYFFPTGRALVRFRNYRTSGVYPHTVVDISDSWGAYRVEPKPDRRDILHVYADNGLVIETDLGERSEMTLENGRRHLFWNKDYMILSEWAAERKPVPCQLPANPDASLINSGISLFSTIAPDEIADEPGSHSC